ncbi:MAG: hypothetical protein KBF21_01470 [Thermoanaerobaculia bacterium]|nr:hypothetical protein [Thermoanaerobaculia bacterium]
MTGSAPSPGTVYRERAVAAAAAESATTALSSRISWARFGAFLLMVVGGGFGVAGLGSGRLTPWIVCGTGLVALAGLISWHERVIRRERALAARRIVNEQAVARLERRFDDLAERSFPDSAAGLPTARDLNLFGPGSVAQWLGAVATPSGRETLAAWLTEGKSPAVDVVARQDAVSELAPEIEFRQDLEVAAMPLAATSTATTRFIEWAEGTPYAERHPHLRLAGRVSALASLASFLLAMTGVVPIHLWLFVLVANYAWTWSVRRSLAAEMERMSAREGAFSGYANLLQRMAARDFAAPGLVAIRARLEASGLDAAAELGRLHRLSELSDVRHSSVHTLLQAAMAWDLLLLERVGAWQRRAGRFVGEWLAAAGELEVLAAFGGVRFDHPDWVFAEIDPAADRLTARGLGHPLLSDAARVGNDVEVGPRGRLLLVTGSNMSGKSTLLRAIGVNASLAQAGAPVCARALRMPPLVVETSGRIDDSLLEGVSYFLAELQRLQAIVARAAAAQRAGSPPVLFLLDEILRGTNSEERRVAVAKIVERLLGSGAIGAVSTHDLEIARVPAIADRLANVHFRETLEEGPEGPTMSFDYRLREGLATTTNALVLLRLVGLDAPPDRPGN